MGVYRAGGALADEEASTPFDDEGGEVPVGDGLARGQIGQRGDAIGAAGDALGAQRAGGAFRLAWRADQRAEFHEGLIQGGTGGRYGSRL